MLAVITGSRAKEPPTLHCDNPTLAHIAFDHDARAYGAAVVHAKLLLRN